MGSSEPGGYREVIRIAFPVILSTASLTLMLFVDRMFLSWYSQDAVALPRRLVGSPISRLFPLSGDSTICQLHRSSMSWVGRQARVPLEPYGRESSFAAVAPLILASIPIVMLFHMEWARRGRERIGKGIFFHSHDRRNNSPLQCCLVFFLFGRGRTAVV